MKMIFSLKSLSRSSVHHDQDHHHHLHQDQPETTGGPPSSAANDRNDHAPTSLTVWRKSLVINCNGFTVIDSRGDIAYRVDNYMGRPDELTLMDSSGKSILTMHRRKKLGMMADYWLMYEGEVGYNHSARSKMEGKKASWCVKKHSSILQTGNHKNVLAYVYRGREQKRHAYAIEGSYTHRSCKVVDEKRRVVAEIRRKEETVGGVSFGVEVFVLVVHSGFDPGFAMGLVLLLDQMF